jgi:MFS family permease
VSAGEPVAAATEVRADDGAMAVPATRARRGTALTYTLALLTLALTYWTVDIVAPALPAIRDDLTLSRTGAGLVFALFFGGRLVANLPAALLVDRTGPKRTAVVGAILLVAGSLLAASATGTTTLLPARVVQGVGVAMLATAGLLSVLRARPGASAMTAFNLSAGIGGSCGLISSGVLTRAIDWRAVFVLSAILGSCILAVVVLRDPRRVRVVREREAVEPGAETAVGGAAVIAALMANLLVYGNYSIWVVSLPLYADERFGADAGRIGTLLLVVNVIHLGSALPAGRVIRLFGAQKALVGGFGIVSLGLALALVAPSQGWLLPPIALYAIGQVTGSSAAGDLLLRLGGQGGRAVGMVRLTSDIGLVAGPAGVGVLADVAGVRAPFAALAGLSALAAVAAWRLSNRPG